MGVQSVRKISFLNKPFDLESTCYACSQSCISCNIQVESFVTHHAQIFQRSCVWELGVIKVNWRQVVRPGIAEHHQKIIFLQSVFLAA